MNDKTGLANGRENVFQSGIDDAGEDQCALGAEQLPGLWQQCQNDVGDNIHDDEIVAAGAICTGRILAKVTRMKLGAIRYMVQRCIAAGDLGRFLIDIGADHIACAEQGRDNRENAAAAAHIQHDFPP